MGVVTEPVTAHAVLCVHVRGAITAADYRRFARLLARAERAVGELRLVVDGDNLIGWAADADWRGLAYDPDVFSKVGRVAIVSERTWHQGLARLCRPVPLSRMAFFGQGDSRSVWSWITW